EVFVQYSPSRTTHDIESNPIESPPIMFFCKKSTSTGTPHSTQPATLDTNMALQVIETTEYKLEPTPFMYFPYIKTIPSYSDCPPVWFSEVKIDAAAFNEK
ncbi:hypothetical protein HDU76_011397, partial [Blyttiomyces sp. JEL0837]